jgi:hypothetical protein
MIMASQEELKRLQVIRKAEKEGSGLNIQHRIGAIHKKVGPCQILV